LKRSELWLGPQLAGDDSAGGLVDRVLLAWDIPGDAAEKVRAQLLERMAKLVAITKGSGWCLHVSFAVAELGDPGVEVRTELVCVPSSLGPGV